MEQKNPQDKIPFPKEQSESRTPDPQTRPQNDPPKEVKEQAHKK